MENLVHLGGRLERPVNQILFLRSEINYTHIFMRNGDHYVVATTLKKLEERLADHGFWRINKSELINLTAARIMRNEGTVKFRNHKPMKISRRKKQKLDDVLSAWA
ncbi:LytTR family transcriptional regulator [Marinilongibacter aquaticus]|uniref:LytR/AlgR family response regulator transcription factor n=1 Tax=Marinilongibacter aquaticus TaxID=2975157 RepID=UPI0021BD331B|nr:LytTR family DNA-binding domain-containing protein [Marinilongibacter aquaticus]UBM58831.1 LytTR family transcriptional regulator [Marinilongibacter aquaticus]